MKNQTRSHYLRLGAALAALSTATILLSSGCQTAGGGGVGGGPNWEVINTSTQAAFKWATVAVLKNNPDYAEQVATVNGGIAVVFSGVPTEEGVRAQILALAPKLTEGQASLYASVVMDAVRAYLAATGKTELIPSDERVAGVVKAVTTGIAEGIALHGALAGK